MGTSDYIITNFLYEVLFSFVNLNLTLDDYRDLGLNKQQTLIGLSLRISNCMLSYQVNAFIAKHVKRGLH